MNAANNKSGSDSATQQPSEHNNYGKLSEAEFLVHQSEIAKTAIQRAVAELKAELSKAGDIKLWAHHYPWASLGVAAATGFSLAALLEKGTTVPTNVSQEEEEHRQRLLKATAQAPYNARPGKEPPLGNSLLGSLFSLARTALEASLVSAIRSEGELRMQPQAPSAPQETPPTACTVGAGPSS